MSNYNFKGKWITAEEFSNLKPVNVFHKQLEKAIINSKSPQNSHILFRKKFVLRKSKAEIYISADDYYKLYINGKFVCQGPAPGYNFHYYYNRVDISDYVTEGENTIAVHTYYQGLINRVWVSGDDRHGMILDIVQDNKVVLSSDEEFLYAYHRGFQKMDILINNTQFTERYISGTEFEDFEKVYYDDSKWKNAKKKRYLDYELFEQPTKMLEFEKIFPTIKYDENSVIADFGEIFVGYLSVEAKGNKGERIELFFGQELNDDCTIRWELRSLCKYREEWILSGNKDKLNEFDYKSFRYVRLDIPQGCKIENIHLIARHYPFELKAKPNVNDGKLLKVWNLCVNSLKYGAQEVIQDCMEREKGNYLGDGCYTALTYTVLTKDASLLKKLFDDSLRSSFIDKGLMTCACCSFMQEIAEYPLMMYFAIYEYYRNSGDLDYLESRYESLCEVLDYYRDKYMNQDNLISGLDKWCVVEWPKEYRDGYAADIEEGKICTDVHSVINAHYIGAIIYMNKICKALGKEPYYDEELVIDAYYRAFYDSKKKLFKDVTTSEHISLISNVFPLMYGIYREKETEEAIISYIEEKGFTTVMLFGAFPILYGMKRIGRSELVSKYLKDEHAWLNMIKEGATRTFEGWSKDSKWNTSLFHLTLSYAALFLTDFE